MDYKEIYKLGMSAATVGKFKEEVTFLKIAQRLIYLPELFLKEFFLLISKT